MKIIIVAGFVFLLICCCCGDAGKKSDTAPPGGQSMPASASAEADSTTCMVTCPRCGFIKQEQMPTAICQLKYTCSSCGGILYPADGDCCVFCTYGSKRCPSMQE